VEKIISFALKHRLFIVIALAGLIAAGLYAYTKLPIDAFPDVTNIQVQVITRAPGRSPVEVEKMITYPLEIRMMGLPKIHEVRSLSRFGLSSITVVFEDDVDIYFARQLVLERIIQAKEKLPFEAEPSLAPISTGLGEVYQYTLEKPGNKHLTQEDLIELKTIQGWTVTPLLKTVSGVADVNSFGGMEKQYQILVDPQKLKKYNIALRELFDAVARNNANAGGNILEHNAEQYIVRGIGLVTSTRDLGNVVVKAERGIPIYVKDVAEVRIGPGTRQGAALKDGQETVGGIVMMIRGGSAKEVVASVKKKVREINTGNILPKGIKITPYYDRTDLVEKSVATVTHALAEGAILIMIVLYLFLRSMRGAFVVAVSLPLAMLSTFIVMWKFGLSANLMSLGGLAISIGMIVDAAVIQVENVQRRLNEAEPATRGISTILEAILEVRTPSFFGELIIAVTFLPIMTLQGIEGKMFVPLALTVVIALLSSMALSLTALPAIISFSLNGESGKESPLVKWSRRIYSPALKWAMLHGKAVAAGAAVLLIGAIALFPFLGREFIPSMDEGSLAPAVIRLPSISLTESIEIEKKVHQTLMKFPEVETVVSKLGAAEIETDPQGPNLSDPVAILKSRDKWTTAKSKEELVEKIRQELEKIPGAGFSISQPIALRVDELISGVKSQLAIRIFGDDLDILRDKAHDIARTIDDIKGTADLKVEVTTGQPYVTIRINRDAIARYGINVADVQEIIETAIGGKAATEVLEGDKRFSVVVRLPEEQRNSIEAIGNILVRSASGTDVPLAQLADIGISDGPVQIGRDNGKRRVVIECNIVGRDIGGFVAEAQNRIEKVKLPTGYYLTWGGAFENQQRAMKRLTIIVPFTIAIIFFLLFITFNSFRYAGLIILTLPFALIGGVLGLFVTGQYLSVPASVGFIVLFGVAVLNGLVLITYINKLRFEGVDIDEALRTGCEKRLRPVLMTASIAILGLAPLLFATGPGSEVQKPLAIVMVGGLITSTLMTLIVLPVIYKWFERNDVSQ
jgi:cobalt-zinc-cadmium resistance protein CzcA